MQVERNIMEQVSPETSAYQMTRDEFVAGKVAEIEAKYGRPLDEVIREKEGVLGTIARMVGSDFGMKASFGIPGEGSFFVPEDKTMPADKWNTINLDPLILLEFDGADEFVAAHEGAHRAITRTLDQVRLKTKKEQDSYASKIGWSSIHNMLEDPAVNDWVSTLYPRISNIMERNYDGQFKEEGAVMSTPQIEQMVAMLGYVPDFVRYGSEVMRYWHKGYYSDNLPESVKTALEATASNTQSFYRTLPYTYPTEREVIAKAKSRWQTYEKEIWPFVQDMIEQDMTDEKLKQFLKNHLQQALKQKDQEGQGQQGPGRSLEELMDEFGFSPEEKKDLRGKIQEALDRKEKQKEQLKEKLANGEISQDEFDKQNQEVDSSLPVDMKSIGSAKQKIADKLSGESKEVQDQVNQAAQESLEHAEDQVNEQLRGKLGPKEETHQQRRERQVKNQEAERERAQKLAEEAAERRRLADADKKYWQEQDAGRTHWERAVSSHAKEINELYQEIEDLFQKRRHPRWEKGHPSGQRLNMSAAMQYEADPRNYLRLWERKTIPDKLDHRFLFLIDLSSSTQQGEIRKNEFEGAAVAEEVVTALGIPSAIVGYTTGLEGKDNEGEENAVIKIYKGFEEDLNTSRDRLQLQLSKLLDQKGGVTPTLEATQVASAMLRLQSQQVRENAHFLIVITDGRPTNLSGQHLDLTILKRENDRLAEDNNQIIIGMGIGSGINEDDLREAYGEGRFVYAKNQRDFPSRMGVLLRSIFFQTQGASNQV